MGLLIDGRWHDQWYDTDKNGGAFKRQASQFRNRITTDGPFEPESGRYHLYVSLACPWAHRALIMRELKGLTTHISISVVCPDMLDRGWSFLPYPGSTGDTLYGHQYLSEIYVREQADITTRVTVPVLWDKQTQRIVNNESADILRILNSAFNDISGNNDDYYPDALQAEIDNVNEWVYHDINNGVYKAGFATEQTVYEEAVYKLFSALDKVESRLKQHRFLVGNNLTEADIRLFTTLVRFDPVYHGHFKCNLKQIKDYPAIYDYMRRIYRLPGIAATTNLDHIKRHYYYSHTMINPTQVVPVGPAYSLWK
ncbi:MAG: glutathione S-transferase family protein [Alteromonadaceae bacterium]|nr:glutathione S-transferase family protein [Alteromonadaceae bacterium]